MQLIAGPMDGSTEIYRPSLDKMGHNSPLSLYLNHDANHANSGIHHKQSNISNVSDNVGTLMRPLLATGPYYMILPFHLHTTSRVCNIIAAGLTMPRSWICPGSRLQMARISLGTLARTCCRPLFGRYVPQWPERLLSQTQ